MTTTLRRATLPLLITAAQVLAAALTLRVPDLARVGRFLTGGVPTSAGALATVEMLLWAVVLTMFGVSLTAAAREAMAVARTRGRHVWGTVALLTGLVVLSAGLAHHIADAPVTLAGGSLPEATELLGR